MKSRATINLEREYGMKTLLNHINDHHGGVKAAFARANGFSPQRVNTMINVGYLVTCEGYLIHPKTKIMRKEGEALKK